MLKPEIVQMSAAVVLMSHAQTDTGLQVNGTILAGALIEGGSAGPSLFFEVQGAISN